MPYIAIKAYPKDQKIKDEIVRRINQAFLDVWGCPQEAINISLEEVNPSDWEQKVKKSEILSNMENMVILDGEKVVKR
ncbi:MAG: tautomerase family protein [Fibrobacter sp.]|nr:tautomerase family protein [Fibrobacter sp.]